MMRLTGPTRRPSGFVLPFPLLLTAPALAQSITIVALQGQSYPTLPPGASLGAFSRDQAISPDGSAVFTAVQGGAGQSIPVLVRSTPAGPQVLARYGDPATGAPAGVTISLMSEAAGLPAGAVFHASLSSPSAPFGQAIYASGTPLAPIAITGQQAPGLADGVVFSYVVRGWSIGARSLVYSLAGSTSNDSAEGLWAAGPGPLSLVAAQGRPAPGTTATWFRFPLNNGPVLSNVGEVAFSATLNNGTGGTGLWAGPPGALRLIARDNQHAPGFPAARTLSIALGPVMNSSGDVLFSGFAVDFRTDPPRSTSALYLAHPGHDPELLAVAGTPAAGTGGTFSTVGLGSNPQLLLTESGFLAFRGTLRPPGGTQYGNDGIWAGRPGDIRLVAHQGDQVPGLPAGVFYDYLDTYAINSRGQIIFDARLGGTGVTSSNNEALFAMDEGRHIAMILRRGDTLFAGGQARTVYVFSLANLHGSGNDGLPTNLNEAGQAAFYVQFLGTASDAVAVVQLPAAPACYANCDASTQPPILNAQDFTCFLERFATSDPWANCDGSAAYPVLNVQDFSCFLQKFAAGCP